MCVIHYFMICRHIGVVGVDVRLSDIEQILFSQQWGSLYSFVTNEEGRVIIHPRLTPAAEVDNSVCACAMHTCVDVHTIAYAVDVITHALTWC